MRYLLYALCLLLVTLSVDRISAQESLDCDAIKNASVKTECKIKLIRTQQSSLQVTTHHHLHHHHHYKVQ
jgi:hypothetical protein